MTNQVGGSWVMSSGCQPSTAVVVHTTQPVPAPVEIARRALYRIMDGEPGDIVDDLAVINALNILEGVTPPYPPVTLDETEWTLDEGLPVARAALQSAVDASTQPREALRYALAFRALPSSRALPR